MVKLYSMLDLFEIDEMIQNAKESIESGIVTGRLRTMVYNGICELLEDRSLRLLPIIKSFEWEELN